MKLKKGDIVVIATHSQYYNKNGSNTCNPINTQGVITYVRSWIVSVNWDNGYNNNYNEADLKFIRQKIDKLHEIWH